MSETKSTEAAGGQAVEGMLTRLPAATAAAGSVLYFAGFVVVNAYAASKGILDLGLLNSRYLAAGALVLTIGALLYFFALRHVRIRADGIKGVEWLNASWRTIAHIEIAADILFRILYVAVMVMGIAGLSFHGLSAYLAAIAFAALSMGTMRLPVGPEVKLIACLVVELVAIGALLAFASQDTALLALCAVLWFASMVLGTVLSAPGAFLPADRTYSVFYLCLYLLIAVAAFGSFVYESIDPRFGGGKPPKVDIVGVAESVSVGKISEKGNPLHLLGKMDDRLIIEERPKSDWPITHFVPATEIKLISSTGPQLLHQYLELGVEIQRLLRSWLPSPPAIKGGGGAEQRPVSPG